MMEIRKATRSRSYLRIAVLGPSGSGKTWNALTLARGLAGPTGRILVIDTERGSASLYAGEAAVAGDFDVIELDSFSPARYTEAIRVGIKEQYDVIVIDSLTHAWTGSGGALEQVDNIRARSNSGNGFVAWRDVTPVHNEMVDAILQAPLDVVITMRVKMEYVQEKDDRGKTTIRKVGLQPQQRDGMEYEFTCILDCDMDHNVIVGKTRCAAIDGKVYRKPRYEIAETLLAWRNSGSSAPAQAPLSPAAPPASVAATGPTVKQLYATACELVGEDRVKAALKAGGYTSLGKVSVGVMEDLVEEMRVVATQDAQERELATASAGEDF